MIIKFRAWHKEEKRMVDSIQSIKTILNKELDGLNKDYIIMQYTGLKDKNGREIYEGDIIEILDKNFKAVVVFSEGCFTIEIIGQDKDYSKCFCLRDLAATSPLAVIGNIWENPELLESEVEDNA